MKRVTVLILSTVVTVLLVVAVLAAGQPRTQTATAPVAASAPLQPRKYTIGGEEIINHESAAVW